METKKTITVQALINAPVEKVWNLWTTPAHITKWNNASDDWHTPRAENDLRVGEKFLYRMEAKDGSFGFDFVGFMAVQHRQRYVHDTKADTWLDPNFANIPRIQGFMGNLGVPDELALPIAILETSVVSLSSARIGP